MTLERSEKGKKAKSVFYQQFNDVDIYVEDTSYRVRKLYAAIFERALEGAYRVETVFPLGGKSTVIRHCLEDQENGGRPRLYVVDGDLDLLTDTNPKGLKRLLVLNRYCIENYLIDEDAIISILNEEDLKKMESNLRSEFKFDKWVQANESGLFNLFVLYAVVKEVLPDCPTVSFPANKLVSSYRGELDPEKLQKRILEIESYVLSTISNEQLNNRVESIVSLVIDSGQNLLSYVSGKDYLIPLLLMRMRNTTKLRADNDVIKQRLAMRCDVSDLSIAVKIIS